MFSIRYDDIFQMMKEGKKELSSNRQKSASLSLLQGSPLGDPLGQAFPRVGQSKTIVLAGTKSPRLTWGSSHSTGPRAGFWPKKEGEEKAVWEGRERTSGQVEARRWSGRVACRVWKRECGPRRTAPPLAPLVLVSSWKSIAGKRVKIHPCPRKNLTQGWTGSAGGGLKSEKEGKGWRGKEKEEGRERERESGRGWGGATSVKRDLHT